MPRQPSTPEIEKKRHALRKRTQEWAERAACDIGPLRPWAYALAEWHATQPGRVTFQQIYDMAVSLASVSLPRPRVKSLLRRDDWIEYREQMAADFLLRIRRKVERRMESYADAHHEALKLATDEGDYTAMAKISEPMLDRLWPKREEKVETPQTLIVNVNTAVHSGLGMQPIEEAEVIEVVEVLPVPRQLGPGVP